jgi:hypothetical protein
LEKGIGYQSGFRKPLYPLTFRTRNHHREHPPVEFRDSPKGKDADLPEVFQRVAKDLLFTGRWRI